MSRWGSHNKFSKMPIINIFVPWKHGHIVATELSRAQLWLPHSNIVIHNDHWHQHLHCTTSHLVNKKECNFCYLCSLRILMMTCSSHGESAKPSTRHIFIFVFCPLRHLSTFSALRFMPLSSHCWAPFCPYAIVALTQKLAKENCIPILHCPINNLNLRDKFTVWNDKNLAENIFIVTKSLLSAFEWQWCLAWYLPS